ncbi:acetate--CoA ligase [Burkholderia sp. RF2-non_BP3]|uniref:acetate--CoA ligase n=1 Tax=Burkholderia sp. RF2-non_BP3 TaxID=1637844 RepID=UPI0007543DC8|nr:acetate--CoA ligase [Burkholderia sp. RF2-non_BP3]KUY55184.1 acetyl-CoA synthetase [Burkholderia sp. RF2-non_BP3]
MNVPAIIAKTPADLRVVPNLVDYDGERHRFSWAAAARELAIEPGGGINIGWQAVDRHCAGPGRDRIALRFLARNAPSRAISYAELATLTDRFCNVLRGLGIGKGDRLFIVAGRIPEMYVGALGALKNGTVVSPLFSAFGPEPIATRVNLGAGTVLLTTDTIFERKIAPWRERMPGLKHVLLVADTPGAATNVSGTHDLASLMAGAADTCRYEPTSPEDMALLHFTSGTTGTPKGAVHVHAAALTHWITGRYALDLHEDDIYWCTADPGWVTGTSYGIIAPLLHGVTSIVDREEFDAERWYGLLEDEHVSVWYTAPTAVRMLMRAGSGIASQHAFPHLRFVASVGEPLNPEAVWWGKAVLGLPIHDNWWQTETGGIMIANTPAFDIKPGSMGRPLPGVDAAIVQRDAGGGVQLVDEPGIEGELALRRGWPSMFRGYLNEDARYRKCFAGDWYLTGDLARRDADGYYWFVGRADDVIKSAGHLIGPFEVESVLMAHPAVAEAAVIGKPDPVVGESIKAFVALNQGQCPDDALRMALLAHARKRLGAAVAPKEIVFVGQLPHTRSGKIMRRLLKARELGMAEGDTSTLESGA